MTKIKSSELLKIPEVIEEIKRHLWIESEKAGHDIGFERAATDWIKKYAQGWINYFRPDLAKKEEKPASANVKKCATTKKTTAIPTVKKATAKKTAAKKTAAKKTTVSIKKRRAKSYSRA